MTDHDLSDESSHVRPINEPALYDPAIHDDGLRWRAGGCHCGAVRFEVAVSDAAEVEDCNCSICCKTGFLHLIVPNSRFRLLQGHVALQQYCFNTGVAKHLFCRHCGIKSFYIPRSNPDGVDVNVRCLDQPLPQLTIVPFDGQQWEQHAAALAHKSRE